MLKIDHIGTHCTIEGWPRPNSLEGLLDALGRWTLNPRLDMREPGEEHLPPYRERAWGHCVGRYDFQKHRTVYEATKPLFPDSPDAVHYFGNFIGYSFGFSLHTDDPEVIGQLDAAIAANMARPGYAQAAEEIRRAEAAPRRRAAERHRA